MTIENYGVNLGVASWEIDFFGRIRSLKDEASRNIWPRIRPAAARKYC